MSNTSNEHIYDDIIDLPHHVSATRPHMKSIDRAAQFAPFAALNGHDAAIKETARLTDRRLELDESAKAVLDDRLRYLQDGSDGAKEADFTYFVPDEMKSGGEYITHTGILKKIDTCERTIMLSDGTVFPLDDLYAVDGGIFGDEWL